MTILNIKYFLIIEVHFLCIYKKQNVPKINNFIKYIGNIDYFYY